MVNRAAARDRFPRRDGHGGLLLLIVLVGAIALLTRLPGLDSSPPGFALDEARAALYARSISADGGHLPLFPGVDEPGARDPLFAWWLKLTGSLSGWSVAGARMATALAGVVVALCCALWIRRALGTVWGITGGLLVATSFWQLTLGRQVAPGMAGTALLSLGVWLLWRGLDVANPSETGRVPRWAWLATAGAAFGLAVYAFAPLLVFVPVVLLACGALIWRMRREGQAGDWRALGIGLATLLALVTPAAIDAMLDLDAAGARIESGFMSPESTGVTISPGEFARGFGTTFESLFWSGPDDPRLNIPGRALLNPLLALWTALGIGYALRFAVRPLHAFTLVWLAGCVTVSAIVAPGHPEILLPATPVMFLFPVLAVRAAHGHLRPRGNLAREVALVLVAGTVIASAGWSISDYAGRWSSSPATWEAFSGDVRDALAALDKLSNENEQVYFSTWNAQPLIDYLAPDRPVRLVDGRTNIIIPDSSARYLVFPRSTAPDPALLRYVTGGSSDSTDGPAFSGLGPDGETAWEIWPVGQSARERLPLTLPTIRFPNRIQLTGFAFAPDFGDVATTGMLPDPPRLVVVLVWSVPLDVRPHEVEIQLVPASQPLEDMIESASGQLSPPTVTVAQPDLPSGRTIVLQRLSVVVPETDDMIVDIQVALRGPDGTIRPPYGPRQLLIGDYAFLNRIQYRPGTGSE